MMITLACVCIAFPGVSAQSRGAVRRSFVQLNHFSDAGETSIAGLPEVTLGPDRDELDWRRGMAVTIRSG
jgi:hypothetical protein